MNSSPPARLIPSRWVNSWIIWIRAMSRSEYLRLLPDVRLGARSPRRSYMRSVCGCTPESSAATLMMYTARSSERELRSPWRPDPRPGVSLTTRSWSRLHAETTAWRLLLVLAQLLEQVFLGAGELPRHLDPGGDEQVAVPSTLGSALSLETERLAVGRAGGDLPRDRPVQRRDADIRPQGGLGVGDRQLERQIVTGPPEEGVLLHADPHEQVARLPTRRARLSPAREPDPGTVLDAGGGLHLGGPPPGAASPSRRRSGMASRRRDPSRGRRGRSDSSGTA